MLGRTGFSLVFFLLLEALLAQAMLPRRQRLSSLDPNSFNSSSDDQTFLVDFYVPHCERCAFLRLELNYLVAVLEDRSVTNITVGTLDCIKYAKFCRELNVTEYPTVGIFEKRGEQHRFIDGSANLLTLKQSLGILHAGVEDVIRTPRDDLFCDLGVVYHLIPGSFTLTIATGVFLIKFYSPKCFYCMQLESTWIELAKKMSTQEICVAELDCTVAMAICKQYDIKHVPVIALFRDGKMLSTYSGPRDVEYIEAFVERENYHKGSSSTKGIKGTSVASLLLACMIYIYLI